MKHGQLNENGASINYSIISDLYRNWKPTKLRRTVYRIAFQTLSKVMIPLVPRTSQHGPLGPPPALKIFFESNLNFKDFH